MDSYYKNIKQTLSYFGKEWNELYYITTDEIVDKLPETAFKTDFFIIAVCINGSIDVTVNKHKNTLTKHHIFIGSPASIIQFKRASDDFKMKIIFFDKTFLLKHFSETNLIFKLKYFRNHEDYIVQIKTKDTKAILAIFDYLIDISKKQSPYKTEIIKSSTLVLLFHLADIYVRGMVDEVIEINKTSKEIYPNFIDLIQVYLPEQKSLDFYAQELCVSTKYLIELIKKEKNTTPRQIIDDQITKDARLFLTNSDMTIKEVAEHFKFSSTASFTRFFKRMTGYTPSEYKNHQTLR